MTHDIGIVGAGIVGLATAYALVQRERSLRIVILEKEPHVAAHQTGHNSGVIHSGIYYKPGSLKARLCVDGARRMLEFCERHGVPTERCGKVIVATRQEELPRLDELHARAAANGVRVEKITAGRLREIEPNAIGIAALNSPDTAIVDFKCVAGRLRDLLRECGVDIRLFTRVTQITERDDASPGLAISTDRGDVRAGFLINCAGLHADMIAASMGMHADLRIVPFRGEYYFLRPESRGLVRGLIYPVPDPALPFLGVHFTRTIYGEVEAGPNAVLAFAREGYAMRTVDFEHLAETFAFPGFWKMAGRQWRTGVYEFWRSMSKGAFVRALQALVPAITEADVVRGGAGVRAQAVDAQGHLVQDFRFVATPRSLHVLNAPSPAATASLAIGEHIANKALGAFARNA